MKRQALLVGAFVLGALALIVVAIVSLGGSLFASRVPAVVVFEGSVRGLYVGAPVTFRGVRVGEVEAIGLQVDPKTLATHEPVRIILNPRAVRLGDGEKMDVAALVKSGLRAKLVPQSFVTGQVMIDLDFKPQSVATLHGGLKDPEIPAMPDRMDAFIQQITELPLRDALEDLRTTLQVAQATMKTAQNTLAVTGREMQSTAAQLRQTLAAGQAALSDVQHSSHTALASVEKLSDTTRGAIQTTQPELVATIKSLREATEAARVAAVRVSDMGAPGSATREELDSALRDLALAARSFKQFSEMLEDQPNALVFGKQKGKTQ